MLFYGSLKRNLLRKHFFKFSLFLKRVVTLRVFHNACTCKKTQCSSVGVFIFTIRIEESLSAGWPLAAGYQADNCIKPNKSGATFVKKPRVSGSSINVCIRENSLLVKM